MEIEQPRNTDTVPGWVWALAYATCVGGLILMVYAA